MIPSKKIITIFKIRDNFRLNSGRDSADKVEGILKKNEKERLSLMEQVLLLDEDLGALEPISINVAAATAQSLQNMV